MKGNEKRETEVETEIKREDNASVLISSYLDGLLPELPEGMEYVQTKSQECYEREQRLLPGIRLLQYLNHETEEPDRQESNRQESDRQQSDSQDSNEQEDGSQRSSDIQKLSEQEAGSQEPGQCALILSGEAGSGRSFIAEQLAAWLEMDCIFLTREAYSAAEWRDLLLVLRLYPVLFVCFRIELMAQLKGVVPFSILITEEKQNFHNRIPFPAVLQKVDNGEQETKLEILKKSLGHYMGEQITPCHVQAILAKQMPLAQFIRFVENLRLELRVGTFAAEKNIYQTDSLTFTLLPAVRTFDELVLPEAQTEKLRKICSMIAEREAVWKNWGFAEKYVYGNGISILFYGAPGTGKTMAAQVMANTLQMPLLRVDVSQLISKYIGETQKNIGRIFDEAARSDCILLFDEADAIFAKRSEVSDAQDRYSNAETAYLLQRMEEYRGISILATNLLQNFDDAFRRRITYMLHFPLPDQTLQRRMWENIFPKKAELDENMDAARLAGSFSLSGAEIKNAALHGAYLAMAERKPVGMKHVIDGIKNELQKQGKQFDDTQKEIERSYI